MPKINEKIDGIIFWNIDNDKLAGDIGRQLENNPPKRIKVIEYTGEKNFPGFYKETEKYTYIEDAVSAVIKEYGEDYYKQLLDMDTAFVKPFDDWAKRLIN